MKRMTRVLIADDHPVVRQGIRSLLQTEPDIEVVAEAEDGEETVRLAVEENPEVVLMDVAMPKVDGLEATRRIKAERPEVRVVVFTIHDEEEYVEGLLKAGADGYLLKSVHGRGLAEAVRLACLGQMVLDPEAGRRMARKAPGEGVGGRVANEKVENELLERELQLLRWMACGMTNAKMADRLGVSERTVKGYVGGVFARLSVRSKSAAVGAAVRLGILKASEL